MSAKYRLTRHAADDIEQIVDYIAQDSADNARKVAVELMNLFARLATMPGIGHTRPELRDPSLRVASVYSYLVIYDPETKPITIMRVVHGARNLDRLGI